MKRMALVGKSSRSSASSKTRGRSSGKAYVLCVRNAGYPVSLELRKIYETRPDVKAAKHDLVRVVDESGEDYLHPSNYFVSVELSKDLERLVAVAR